MITNEWVLLGYHVWLSPPVFLHSCASPEWWPPAPLAAGLASIDRSTTVTPYSTVLQSEMSSEKVKNDPDEVKVNGGEGEEKKEKVNKELANDIHEELEDMEAYHGALLEDDVKGLLPKRGDFVLRIGGNGEGTKDVYLSVNWDNSIVDLKLKGKAEKEKKDVKEDKKKSSKRKKKKEEKKDEEEGELVMFYTLDNKTKSTRIKELVRLHQMGKQIEVDGKEPMMLLNPIAKQAWELRRESIELIKKLGEGAFGEVWSAKRIMRLGKTMNVAVKVIKTANNEKATTELQKEGSLMRKFNHPNVVRTFGMVIERDTIMVVMELITGGGLNDYVKKNKVPMDEKGAYALDIANGLAYIHSLGCIHRDIACRNCLIDVVRKQAKVSDFGLTRQTECYKITGNEKIPIRWLAPEVLKTYEYTRAADIYAYAIMVWELINDGAMPFDAMTNAQIKDGIVRDDFRPQFAADVPNDLKEIVGRCWLGDARSRPSMAEVKVALKKYKKVGIDDQDKLPVPSCGPSSSETQGPPVAKPPSKGDTVKRQQSKKTKKVTSKDKTMKSTRKK